jgi:hypothetical protein
MDKLNSVTFVRETVYEDMPNLNDSVALEDYMMNHDRKLFVQQKTMSSKSSKKYSGDLTYSTTFGIVSPHSPNHRLSAYSNRYVFSSFM